MPFNPSNCSAETNTINYRQTALPEILENVWDLLAYAARHAREPFHTPVVGTQSVSGCDLRTVVLRQAQGDGRKLVFHSDRRSSKISQLGADQNLSWLFYDPARKLQLRAYGPATVHTDDLAAAACWERSALSSRRCYLTAAGPGAERPDPGHSIPGELAGRSPSVAESEAGRINFCAVSCRVDRLDWLYLSSAGHLRARYAWQDEQLSCRWIEP